MTKATVSALGLFLIASCGRNLSSTREDPRITLTGNRPVPRTSQYLAATSELRKVIAEGESAIEAGDWKHARECFLSANSIKGVNESDGPNEYLETKCAEVDWMLGNYEEARSHLRAVYANPKSPYRQESFTLTRLGELELKSGNSRESEEAFRAAFDAEFKQDVRGAERVDGLEIAAIPPGASNTRAAAHLAAAYQLMFSGREATALEEADLAFGLAPEWLECRYVRASCLRANGLKKEAMEQFDILAHSKENPWIQKHAYAILQNY